MSAYNQKPTLGLTGNSYQKRLKDHSPLEWLEIGDVLARRSGIAGVKAKLTDLTSGSLLAETIRDIDDAFNLGAPVLHDGETRDKDGRRMLFRSILLPLSDDQGHIRQLLAAARYKAVIDEGRRPSA